MPATLHTFPASRSHRDLQRAFEAARIEVAKCQLVRDDLISKLARRDMHGVTHAAIRDAKARLAQANALWGQVAGLLLDADTRADMECPDDLGDAMGECLERIETPALADENDEQRLTRTQLLGGRA